MLKEDRHITASGPMLAQKRAAGAGTAQAVTEQNNSGFALIRWKINTQRDIAIALRIMNGQVDMRWRRLQGDRQRVIGKGVWFGHTHHEQRQDNGPHYFQHWFWLDHPNP